MYKKLYFTSPINLLLIVCLTEIISMTSYATWPIFLVKLQPIWNLNNFQTGWVSGSFFIGYVIGTPVLVGLTDILDSKKIYIYSCLISFFGAFGFWVFANGFWSACFYWGLVGLGLSGTYMPGLQILNERLDSIKRIKLLPYYTASFGFGTAFSFFTIGLIYSFYNWKIAFIIGGLASLFSLFLILIFVKPIKKNQGKENLLLRHPLNFTPVIKNKPALKYILAYGAHTYELFAYRSWLFAFLVFIVIFHKINISHTTLSFLISLFAFVGTFASIIGAKYSLEMGRKKMIKFYGFFTFIVSLLTAFTSYFNLFLVLILIGIYNFAIHLDSASLTAGTVENSKSSERGALLAVHSIVGFTGGAIGGPLIGLTLDIFGGQQDINAWALSICLMGFGSLIVYFIMLKSKF